MNYELPHAKGILQCQGHPFPKGMPFQRNPSDWHGEESLGPLGPYFKKKLRTLIKKVYTSGEKIDTLGEKVHTSRKKCVL